jgi:hypothetical protein
MKMPDPTMPPITSMVASNKPICRASLAGVLPVLSRSGGALWPGAGISWQYQPAIYHGGSARPAACQKTEKQKSGDKGHKKGWGSNSQKSPQLPV